MSKLHIVSAGTTVPPERPTLTTPAGPLTTWFAVDGWTTDDGLPDACRRLATGTLQAIYRTDRLQGEVLIGPIIPALPPGMAVGGCVAAIWRVRALQQLHNVRFECSWCCIPAEADGGPAPGEGLDAQTWTIGNLALSVGTQDGELLASLATRGDGVPPRLVDEFSLGTIEYSPAGLVVPFSGLHPTEWLQVHFIVAWQQGTPRAETATWFAVEQPSATLLDQMIPPER